MQNFLIAVAITLCMCFGLFLRYAPFADVVTLEQKRKLILCYAVLTTLNVILLTAALYIWGLTAAFTYLRFGGVAYAAVMALVNILVIGRRIREHLFVCGVVISCNYLLMSIPNYVVTFFAEVDLERNLYAVLEIYGGVLLLTYWPLRKLLCNTVTPFLHLDDGEYWNTVWFIPIALFGTKFIFLGGEHNTGGIQQLMSNLLYIVMIVLMCMSIAAAHERMRKHQIIENQLEAQRLHYAELKARVDEARKTKHDFKHHIAAIRHYMDTDDKQGLRTYCDAFIEQIDGKSRIPYTGNGAVDGVLYYYMQRAEQEHIDLRYSGTVHCRGIADTDLCVLLGNALDNAITACLTISEGRRITVISHGEEQLFSFIVRNTFDGKVEQSETELLSRKRENRSGLGLSSMRSICERYGGSMEIQWDEHHFTVMFMLPMKNNES